MRTDKIRKYLIPNIPYLFILWAFLKLGTAYRLAAGNDFAHKLIGLGQTIGPAFADFAPGLAPLDWLAEVKGVSIDEAVKMRTDAVLQEAVVPITVSVRPIEPQGKLIGFASVNFGGVVIDDFKVVDGKNGIFLGAPSKPDPASRTGYRATVRIPDRAIQERINAAGVEAYHAAVEQLVARAQAVRPAPIKEQMAEAAKQAGKENAARPAPAKAKEARNDR